MLTRRLRIKLAVLGALCLSVACLPDQSSAQGRSCYSECITFDDGWPGCATTNTNLGSTCGMIFMDGENFCVQWQCNNHSPIQP